MLRDRGRPPTGARRRDRRAADDPGAARGAARPARARSSATCSSAARSRARCSTAAQSSRCSPSTRRPRSTHGSLTLVRKDLVRPERTPLPADEAFRFRHLLIRDAAYEALPKATRAALHERFAAWLEEHGANPRRAGRDRRLPPRAGVSLSRRARAARRGRRSARPAGRRTADRSRTTSPGARGRLRSAAPARAWRRAAARRQRTHAWRPGSTSS